MSMKLLGGAFFILHSSFFVSCSDWDDHYAVDSEVTATQQSTLWQNISSQANLTDFAALLKGAGYDEVLSQSQTYTVWAPVNGSFDAASLTALGDSRLVREFIQNHIARNNYPVSGAVDQNVFMLNEKMMHFAGIGNYTMSGVGIETANIGSSNGTLHVLSQRIPFLANIYESLNSEQFALDSVSSFFHAYDVRELDEERSVQGPMLDGEITYLDSVFNESNTLFQSFRAYINREDSNYTVLLPTNEAWRRARLHIQQYYQYLPSFEFMENTSATDSKMTTVTLKDAAFLTDSVSTMSLLEGLFFNNNLYDNGKLAALQNGQQLQCDSLVTTSHTKMFAADAAQLFEGTQRVDKSNGAVFVTDDSLRLQPWTVWNPELRQEAEFNSLVAGSANVAGSPSPVYVSETTQNPAVGGKVSSGYYLEAQPSASNANPEVDIYLRNVRSTEYAIYAIIIPAHIINPNREQKPNRMAITMGYNNEQGKNKETRLRNPVDSTNYFINDPSKIDTLWLGDFTFPMAYVGAGSASQDYYPYLRIRSNVTNALSAEYDRTLRIDKFILRPKALDNYLKEHPGYKYDDGEY